MQAAAAAHHGPPSRAVRPFDVVVCVVWSWSAVRVYQAVPQRGAVLRGVVCTARHTSRGGADIW